MNKSIFNNESILNSKRQRDVCSSKMAMSPVSKQSVSKPSQFLLNNLNSAILCAALAFAGASEAAINTKDPAFNSGNPVEALLGGTRAQALDLEVTHDNKIYSVGKVYKNNKWQGYIARYDANGNLDTSFDGDGIAYSSSTGVSSTFNAVTLLPNGKVLVAETQQPQARQYTLNVYRFNQDGSVDTTFGTGGKATTILSNRPQYPYPKTVKDIGVDAAGRILVLVDYMISSAPFGVTTAGSTQARVYAVSADGRSVSNTHTFDYQGRGLANVILHRNYSRVLAESLLFVSAGKFVVVGAVEQSQALSKSKAEMLIYANEAPASAVSTTTPTYRGSFSPNQRTHHWYKSAIKTVGGKVLAGGCTNTAVNRVSGMLLTEFTEGSGSIAKSNPPKEYISTNTAANGNYCIKDLVQHPKNNKIIGLTQGYRVNFATFNPSNLTIDPLNDLSLASAIKVYKMDIMPNGKIAVIGYNTSTQKAVLAVYEGYSLFGSSSYGSNGPNSITGAAFNSQSTSNAFSLNNASSVGVLIYAGQANVGSRWVSGTQNLPINATNLMLRHTAGSAAGQTKSTALVFKNGNIIKRNNRLFKTNDTRFVFSSSTIAPDTTPDSFTFTDQTNLNTSTRIVSNRVTIQGINTNAPIRLTGAASSTCEYRVSTNSGSSWGAWGRAAGTVTNNSLVEVGCTTPNAFGRASTANLVVGSFTAPFRFTTKAADTTPDSFSFTAKTNQELNRAVQVTVDGNLIKGINTPAPISITGGEYSLFDVSSMSWRPWRSTPSTISNNTYLKVRHTTSSSYSTNTTTTLTIGGVSANFVSTTKANPNPGAGIGPGSGGSTGGGSTGGGSTGGGSTGGGSTGGGSTGGGSTGGGSTGGGSTGGGSTGGGSTGGGSTGGGSTGGGSTGGGSTGGGTDGGTDGSTGGDSGGSTGGGATLPIWLSLFGLLALMTRKRRMAK